MRIPAPVIIIGMHRSGTSLVAKLLEKAGIFMGVIKDHNYEAMHFLSLNQQTLFKAGGDWTDPLVPEELYWSRLPAEVLYFEHFKAVTKMQQLQLKVCPKSWGWKDPRNTFTLPMWLDMFPSAKILKVERNTEAVLKSLQTRNNTKGEVFDERLNDRDFCLSLIQQYQQQAETYKSLPNYYELKYEELVLKEYNGSLQTLSDIAGKDMLELVKYYVR